MILPHDPWVGTPVRRTVSGQQEQFAAMVEYMDSLVGSVLDRLDKDGIASRTLVVFLADNGTHPMISSLRNGVRVQGGKGSTLDAGTHVPLIMRWPARFKARQPSEQLVDLVDVYATILAAAGQTEAVRVSDGYDLTPGVTDRGGPRRQSIFMDYARGWWPLEPTRYAFTSRWKLYGDGRFFDTQSDPLESRPLSPGQISEEAAGTHAMLSRTLAEMHDHPMTASDPHFPAGFDPTTVDLTGATRQLAEMNRECGDPARIP
jgi:arylsulfatase A-like enzyme